MTDNMGKLIEEARIKAEVNCDCPDCIRIGRHGEQCSLCGDIYAVKSTEKEIQEAQDEYEWSVDLERAKEK